MKTSLLPARSVRARIGAALALVLFASLSSCDDNPVGSSTETPRPKPGLTPMGLVEVTINGLGEGRATATATGLNADLTPTQNGAGTANGTLQLEQVTTGSFTEGTRGVDGQRYMYATFRVRNAQSDGTPYDTPRRNVTFVAVSTATSLPGTPVSVMRRFDGSEADAAIAPLVVPTGAVALGDSLQMRSLRPDVLQAFTEAEVAAIPVPAAVTNVFPYGFVVSNPNDGASRGLPANPAPNQFDGLVTFAFRVPMQASDAGTTNGATKDVFTLTMRFLAVDDSETRLTESMEEQTNAARASIATRASALGATMVTVLNGSPTTYPTGAPRTYPGRRQICGLRTAGVSGAPLGTVTAPGAYSHLAFYTLSETMDGCAPLFRTGEPSRPAVGVDFAVRVYSMDRYGNRLTAIADTASLRSQTLTAPPIVTHSPAAPLVNGEATLSARYGDYGRDTLYAVGRRTRGAFPIDIMGMVRTWTAGGGNTDWNDPANWSPGRPFPQDTVSIPLTGSGIYPELDANETIGGVIVADDARITLGSFNLTATSSVQSAPFSGGIVSTSGRLLLTGIGQSLSGRVPRLRVTGSYSLTGNLQTVAPLQTQAGRLRNTAFRIRVDGQ